MALLCKLCYRRQQQGFAVTTPLISLQELKSIELGGGRVLLALAPAIDETNDVALPICLYKGKLAPSTFGDLVPVVRAALTAPEYRVEYQASVGYALTFNVQRVHARRLKRRSLQQLASCFSLAIKKAGSNSGPFTYLSLG